MTITNQSSVQFSYTLPDGSMQTETRQSNIVTTDVLTNLFTKVKSSSKTFLQEGETATQTVLLTNNSQYNLSNVFFSDTMSNGVSHVLGSVIVNGVNQPTYNVENGFDLDDIAPNGVTTINYDVIANNPKTNESVTNFATINYTANERPLSENTNMIELALVSNRLSIVKTVDKSVATRGETLHYVSTITNTGSLPKTNLTFTDQIPTGTTFVAGSVRIDGVSQTGLNPSVGFPLSDLAVGANVVVEFDVLVN